MKTNNDKAFAPALGALSRALALILCLLILLPFAAGCGGKRPEPEPEPEPEMPSPVIELYSEGKWNYRVLAARGRGEMYDGALSRLLSLFASTFGSSPETVYIDELLPEVSREEEGGADVAENSNEPVNDAEDISSSSPDPYSLTPDPSSPDPSSPDPSVPSDLIIFGDSRRALAAEERAREALGGEGICVGVLDGVLSLYASEDKLLFDLIEMFRSRIKSTSGAFEIDKDLFLLRRFVGAEISDGAGYDYTLPLLSIDTEDGREVTSRSVYVGASVSVTNTFDNLTMNSVSAQIRGRGNGTWQNVLKKPYKLKFDSKVDLLGIAHSPDRDYILLSNPFDYTNLRNALAFTLAKDCFENIDYASNYIFVNFFLNGIYRGIYMICEENEASSGKIQVKEDPESVRGSEYLVELDTYITSDRDAVYKVDYFQSGGKPFRIRSDYNSSERCAYVKSVFDALFKALRSGDWDSIKQYIDVPSAVDTYLLYEFMKNTDVGWSSFYMVLRSDGKIYFTAPWDFDLSSGNDYRVDDGSHEGLYVGTNYHMGQSSPIFYLLMDCPDFYRLAASRWTTLSAKVVSVSRALIDDTLAMHRPDLERDSAKRVAENGYNDKKNYSSSHTPSKVLSDNMDYLKNWLISRAAWLDEEFSTS